MNSRGNKAIKFVSIVVAAMLLLCQAARGHGGQPAPLLEPDMPWTIQPNWLGNPAGPGDVAVSHEDGIFRFRVRHGASGMKWRGSVPERALPPDFPFVTFRYRAVNAEPSGGYLLTIFDRRGETTLFQADRIISDGHWRTVSVPAETISNRLGSYTGVAVQLQAADSDALLEIADLRLTRTAEPVGLDSLLPFSEIDTADTHRFLPIPFSESAREENSVSVEQWLDRLGVPKWFPHSRPIRVGEIPFQLSGTATLPGTPHLTPGRISVDIEPVSASEVYLVLLAHLTGRDWAVFGGGSFESIGDVDRFLLRIHYEDGEIDEGFPKNILTNRYHIKKGIQAVAVSADPTRRIRRIELTERTNQGSFSVAAITLNRTSGRTVFKDVDLPSPLLVDGTRTPAGSGSLSFRLREKSAPILEELTDSGTGWHYRSKSDGLPEKPLIELEVDGRTIPPEHWKATASSSGDRKWTWRVSGQDHDLLVGLRRNEDDRPGRAALQLVVKNAGSKPVGIDRLTFRIGPYRLSETPEDSWYYFPSTGAVCSSLSAGYRVRYGGYFPVQFLDSFAPKQRRGLVLHTQDRECLNKTYALAKEGNVLTLQVDFVPGTILPDKSFLSPHLLLDATDGAPGRGMEIYRRWLATWYRPAQEREPRFREAFNFRQCFLHNIDPLMDKETGRIDFQKAVDECEREFGGIDFFHLFDWGNCGAHGRIYGRKGDFSPWEFLPGGLPALRAELKKLQDQGIPTGFYLEGYLLGPESRLREKSRESHWELIDAGGKPCFWPGGKEAYMCPGAARWLEIMSETYAEKVRELDADGMYLDQFGFAGARRDCHSDKHGHAVPGFAPLLEKEMTAAIRAAISEIKPNVVLYTEEVPVDVTTQYQDGSFSYAMMRYKSKPNLVPLSTARFAFPDFKIFHILICDQPTGPWATGVRSAFFNGDGIWLEGPALTWFTKETREEIKRCHRVLRDNKDAFTGPNPECLIPTEKRGVYANLFRSENKEVMTLFNANFHTVRGCQVKFPHNNKSLVYRDAFSGDRLDVLRESDHDLLELKLDPMGVGCIVIRP